MALYDRIGQGYDATRRADPAIVGRLIDYLGAEPAGTYLDVACGTGNYTAALAAAGIRICGLDRSARMLQAAREKRASLGWLIGDAVALPFRAGTFSGAVCTLALHHFRSLAPVFREVRRVLGRGRLVLFTGDAEQMRGYWLNEYFPVAMARSIEQMPAREQVVQALRDAGFGDVRTEPYVVAPDLQDRFLYSGKHRPEMYLDPRVRAGISTFSVLANPDEVEAGCQRLEADVQSGRIAEVMAAYRHDRGDYLFVVADRQGGRSHGSPRNRPGGGQSVETPILSV
jgi:SAM-dependent methyltransferase